MSSSSRRDVYQPGTLVPSTDLPFLIVCFSTVEITSPTLSLAKKRAHFGPSITVSSASTVEADSLAPLPSPPALVEDLCKTILKGPVNGSYLGMFEDQSWQYSMYQALGPGSKGQVSEAICLKDAISGSRSISTKQKYVRAMRYLLFED